MFDHESERDRKYKLPKFANRIPIGVISPNHNAEYAGGVNKRIITLFRIILDLEALPRCRQKHKRSLLSPVDRYYTCLFHRL